MTRFSTDTIDQTLGPVRLLIRRTGVPSVVSVGGSFDLYPDIAAGDEMIAAVAVALLDKGTRRRDRFQTATILEERGAHITYSASDLRLRFSARLLSDDLHEVLDVLGEQLREPLFESGELEKVKARLLGSIRRQTDDTGHRAAECLSRHLYGPDHPNRMVDPRLEEERLARVTTEAVRSFHERAFRGQDIRAAVVGDVDPDRAIAELGRVFEGWPSDPPEVRHYEDPAPSGPGREVLMLTDRPNLDVRIGHTVDIRRNDPDFEALALGCFILGGNFSARLMSRIRDERGLTYGISSSMSGVDVRHSGYWRTAVTLSSDRLEEGIRATIDELDVFVREGVDESEVVEKRETLAGQFQVSLATTNGMAGALLRTVERDQTLEYLDSYPDRMRALTAEEVNRAIRGRLDVDRLFVAAAGTAATSR